mmetsp:Transcript_1758/g.4995  ORF Transcript_1758/g.4995 Transcript_1758/m.4995 type:complete len:211 (+) Transcript_1758:2562-3194(+)
MKVTVSQKMATAAINISVRATRAAQPRTPSSQNAKSSPGYTISSFCIGDSRSRSTPSVPSRTKVITTACLHDLLSSRSAAALDGLLSSRCAAVAAALDGLLSPRCAALADVSSPPLTERFAAALTVISSPRLEGLRLPRRFATALAESSSSCLEGARLTGRGIASPLSNCAETSRTPLSSAAAQETAAAPLSPAAAPLSPSGRSFLRHLS